MDKHRFSILECLHICVAFAYLQHTNAETTSTTAAATTTNRYTTVQTTTVVAQSTSINTISFPTSTKAVGSTPTRPTLAQTTTAASPSVVAQTTIDSQTTTVAPTTIVSSITQTTTAAPSTTTLARTTAVSTTTNTAASSVTQTTTLAPSTTTIARMTTVVQTTTATVARTVTTASTTSPASPSTISLASTTTAPAIAMTSLTSRPLTSNGVPTTLTTNVLTTSKGVTTADISTTTTNLHYCLSNPCQNGGTCTENATTYTCICVPGYTDARCEIEINECATLPCYPFGRCTDKINDYNCSCNAGFTPGNTDKQCNEIDECKTNNVSCENHGICHDYINTFQCQCPLTADGTAKYYGNFCEKTIAIIPQINRVSKAFGILSGGAALTFYGTDLDKLPPFGVNFTTGTGKPLFGYVQAESIQPTSFVAITPKASEDLIDVELMLVVIFSGGTSQNLTLTFKYVANPGVVDITPRVQLATGGILLTVMGTNLDAAVTSIMTVDLQLFYHNGTMTTQSYSQVCSALNGTAMNCRLPFFNLPPTFFDTNETTTTQNPVVKRRRRQIQSTSAAALQTIFHSLKNFLENILYTVVFRDERSDTSPVRKLRSRRSGPTASLNASDGIVAKMYLGFRFDNDPTFENISKSLPNITFNLITQGPRFSPTDNEQDQTFDPNKQEPLQIKANNLTLGCSKGDYNVSVGAGVCNVSELTDNVLTCSPPVETPPVDKYTLKNCRSNDIDSNYLAVVVRVSTIENFAFCVQYSQGDSMDWVIGAGVGCGCALLLLILTVAVSVKIRGCIRKRKSRTTRRGIDPPPEPNRVYGRQRGQSGTNGDHGPPLTRDDSGVEMRSYRSGRSRGFGIAPFLAFGKRISYTRQNPERDNVNRYYDTRVIDENDNNDDHDYSVHTQSHLRRMAGDNSKLRPVVESPEVEKWNRRPVHVDDDGRGIQGGEHKWKFNYPNVDPEDSNSLPKDYLNQNELTNERRKYYERHGV